jgi:hypothetical protein
VHSEMLLSIDYGTGAWLLHLCMAVGVGVQVQLKCSKMCAAVRCVNASCCRSEARLCG